MHTSDKTPSFGALRALLQSPPSPQAWREIERLLLVAQRALGEVFWEEWAPYARDHLARWPVTLRVLTESTYRIIVGDCDLYMSWFFGGLAARHASAVHRFAARTPAMDVVSFHPVRGGCTLEELRAVFASSNMRRVRHVAINHDENAPDRHGDALAEALASAPLESLETLRLRGQGLTARGVSRLATHDTIPHTLRVLDLGSVTADLGGVRWGNPIGDEGIRAIAAEFTGLRTLFVPEAGAGGEALASLCLAPGMASLESLNLGGQGHFTYDHASDVGDAVLRALAASEHVRLRALHMRYCAPTTPAIAAYLSSANTARLEVLNLGGHVIVDDTIEAFVSADLPALRTLRLNSCRISPAQLDRLCDAPWMRHVTELGISYSEDDAGVLRVLAERLPRELQIVSVGGYGLTELDGASALLEARPTLTLHTESQVARCTTRMIRSGHLRATHLDLGAAHEHLARMMALAPPRHVTLAGINRAEIEPFFDWLSGPGWSRVERLALSGTALSDARIHALARLPAQQLPRLRELELAMLWSQGHSPVSLMRMLQKQRAFGALELLNVRGAFCARAVVPRDELHTLMSMITEAQLRAALAHVLAQLAPDDPYTEQRAREARVAEETQGVRAFDEEGWLEALRTLAFFEAVRCGHEPMPALPHHVPDAPLQYLYCMIVPALVQTCMPGCRVLV